MRKVISVPRDELMLHLRADRIYSHARCERNGLHRDLEMAVLGPNPKTYRGRERMPVLLWIPGGAFLHNDWMPKIPCLMPYAKAGYLVIGIRYRCSGESFFPAQVEDVKTAVRYIRAHADELGADDEHIACLGVSAGGTLAAFAGMNTDGFDTEEWRGYSSSVCAAVCCYGVHDLTLLKHGVDLHAHYGCTPEVELVGGEGPNLRERLVRGSSITYVNSGAAPFFILHGIADPLVSPENSEKLYEALLSHGVPTELRIIEGAGHSTPEFFQQQVSDEVIKFLDQYCK